MKIVDFFSLVNLISGITALWMGKFIHSKEHKGYLLTLVLLLISLAWWNLSLFMENFSVDLSDHVFWNIVSYPGIMSAPVLLFIFFYQYTHFNKKLPPLVILLLFVVPIVSCLIVTIPGTRPIIWEEVILNQTTWGNIVNFKHGWWYYVEVCYSDALMITGIIFLIRGFFSFPKQYSQQVILLIGSSFIPLLLNIVYSFKNEYFYGLDLTPIVLIISMTLVYIAIMKHQLLNITPIAWNVIFENIKEGVIIIAGNIVVNVNKSAKKIFKSDSFSDIEGRLYEESFSHWSEFIDFMNDPIIEKQHLVVGNHCYEVSKTPISNTPKSTTGQIIIFHDITKIVKKEAKIEKINHRLKEANQTKDLLFKVISHDLRGAIGTLNSFFEFYLKEDLTPDKRTLTTFYKTSSSLYLLTENLLQWAKSQQNEIALYPGNYAVSNTVKRVVDSIKLQADNKEITLTNDCTDEKILACYDAPSIEIVIRNLVSNAIKFSHPKGEIKLSLIGSEHEVSFHVCDQGIGLSEEMQNDIQNNIAVKSAAGTMNEKGTGIGLSLCKRLTEANNGKLSIQSTLGKGTTVTISLPVNNPAPKETGQENQQKEY